VAKSASIKRQIIDFSDRAEELTLRAQKLRRKGELRRAAVTLREACALEEENAARWMLLGDVLFRTGKREEAAEAMKQALYLRQQRGERGRVNTIRRILLNLASPVASPRGRAS
jgi:Flp pilus assembly protein TadD